MGWVMSVINAKYSQADQSSIVATIDGVETFNIITAQVMARDGDIASRVAEWIEAGNTIDPYQPPPIAPEDVQAERERRLQLGFDYDFGDGRGVHRIGTTAADMVGWNDVDKAANALSALGDNITTMTIVTDTGPVDITSSEWMQITLAATAFRQPIWAGSFDLQAMDPIPADYATNDAYWSA
jgi:hypothetical protein